MSDQAILYEDLERVLITGSQIKETVERLGAQITRDYQGKSPVMICILKGAVIFFSDLIRNINLPVSLDFMAISSYGSSTKTSGVVRILKDLDHDVVGRDVIVVEDIVDSGLTLSYIQNLLGHRGARSVKIATLLDKPERRRKPLTVDYCCFTIPNEFVVGYGLDYNEKYRNMPDVGVLSPRIYSEQ